MSAISWRDALTAGLSLVAIATPVAAQEQELLTLEDALSRTGVVGETADPELNPRIVGPRLGDLIIEHRASSRPAPWRRTSCGSSRPTRHSS